MNDSTQSLDGDALEWRERRRAAALEQGARLEERRQTESAKAREQIAEFVAKAKNLGVTDVPLRARSMSGGGSYRTPLRGWYIKQNHTIAIGTDGEFYALNAQTGPLSRLTGITPLPQDPPLVVGAGGRDGESLELKELLARRLVAGDSFG